MKVFLLSRDTFIFLFFVIISGLFWVIISLNKTYETRITVPISYTNVPPDIELNTEFPKSIVIKVSDKGTSLLGYLNKEFQPLVVDFKRFTAYGNSNEWNIPAASAFDKEIKEMFNPSTQVTDIIPNAIIIEKASLSKKRVPIIPRTNIACARQHFLTDSIRIEPSEITLYGQQEMIDTIQHVYTEVVKATELTSTLIKDVQIILPDKCKSDSKTATITAPIECYTENKQMVPISIVGTPENILVRTFPSEVEVTYMIAVSRFHSVIPSDFSIVISYEDILSNKSNLHALTLERYPTHIRNPRIKPDKVECMIEIIK
jgi:hypothetical protein